MTQKNRIKSNFQISFQKVLKTIFKISTDNVLKVKFLKNFLDMHLGKLPEKIYL